MDSSTSDNTATNEPQWIQHLPEAFGIRQAVQQSKYRWCVRESAMWGIATGTAMSLHRLRMRSPWAINAGFLSFFGVYVGSYYFCVKRRDYKEQVIEMMMKLNSFQTAADMPEPVPVDENHPFVSPEGDLPGERQYVANLPERKEWQKPLPTQDAASIFTEDKPR